MNYLIISDAGSMHVYNFIKNSLLGRGFSIYIVSHSILPIPNDYIDFYKANRITIYSLENASYASKASILAKIKKLIFKIKCITSIGRIDICHIHCLATSSCLLYLLLRNRIKHLILTFWGSDIIRTRKIEMTLQKTCIPFADSITLSTQKTLQIFHKKFGTSFDKKVRIVRFISGALEDIKRNNSLYSREQCKNIFSFPEDKISVMVGYNASPEQHQDKCILNLSRLDVRIKQRIHLIVPLQYARTDINYIESVINCLRSSGFTYSILEEYLDSNKMSKLSIATDIYINARDTDAFSCCMKEQLYAGSLMIQGRWLEYKELDDVKWQRYFIDSRENLANTLQLILNKYNYEIPKIPCELMWKLFSPNGVREQWDEVLTKVSN